MKYVFLMNPENGQVVELLPSEVVHYPGWVDVAALRAERDELIAALKSVDALIEEDMGEWYGVDYAYCPTHYSNRAHIRDGIADVLAKYEGQA